MPVSTTGCSCLSALRWVLAPRQRVADPEPMGASDWCCFGIAQCAHLDSERWPCWRREMDKCGHGGVRVSQVAITWKLPLLSYFFAQKDWRKYDIQQNLLRTEIVPWQKGSSQIHDMLSGSIMFLGRQKAMRELPREQNILHPSISLEDANHKTSCPVECGRSRVMQGSNHIDVIKNLRSATNQPIKGNGDVSSHTSKTHISEPCPC
jgi:hypothetical protein